MSSPRDDLDLAQTLSLLGHAVDAHVIAALRAEGLTGLRFGHGYVVQRLIDGPSTVSEIADSLEITQQAVSKSVRELVGLGYVAQTIDTADRRRRPLELTASGHRAVAVARRSRRDLESRIRIAVGDRRFSQTAGVLESAMRELGLDAQIDRRRVSPPPDRS
jgi:DNA-binding MarR family transcriptional regulator